MKGLVEKMVVFAVMSVASIGGVGGYNLIVGEEQAISIEDLAKVVDWDNLSVVITAALGK